jgi:type III secretory pathway component EscV
MNIFKQVTSPAADSKFMLVVGAVCLLIALIPPYEHRAALFLAIATVNLVNGWRLRRKIAAAKGSESHSDS